MPGFGMCRSAHPQTVSERALFPPCAGGADVPAALQTEAERIAAIDGPSGWERIEPPQLIDGQFVRDVDGVPMLFAGEVRADGDVRPLSAGTAWRSIRRAAFM